MFIKSINNSIEKLLYWLTAITAFFFFFMVIAGVGSRYIFLTPIAWSIEVSRLLFIWSCFLAAALTYRKKSHISISFLTDKFSKKNQYFAEIIRQLLSIVFMLLIFSAALQTIESLWFSTLPVLQISQGWLYIPVVVTAMSIVLFTFEELVESITKIQRI